MLLSSAVKLHHLPFWEIHLYLFALNMYNLRRENLRASTKLSLAYRVTAPLTRRKMDRKGRWHGVTSMSFLTQFRSTILTSAGLWAGGVVTPPNHENQKCQFNTLSDVHSKRPCFLRTMKINANNMRILSTSSRPSPCWTIKGFTPFGTELMTQRRVI